MSAISRHFWAYLRSLNSHIWDCLVASVSIGILLVDLQLVVYLCAWSRVVDRTLSLGNGLLVPKLAKIYRCAGLQNKRLFIAKGKDAPQKADFFACLSGARPKPMAIPSEGFAHCLPTPCIRLSHRVSMLLYRFLFASPYNDSKMVRTPAPRDHSPHSFDTACPERPKSAPLSPAAV